MPLLLASGCDRRGPLSTLDPAGPSADAIATVWWWMFGVAALVTIGVIALWLIAMRRCDAAADDDPRAVSAAAERTSRRWIVAGGVLLPALAIVALLVFGTPAGRHQLPWPASARAPAPLRIDAIGHQWWWELRYPASGVRLENEMRMPVGRPVDVHTSSADVIHSFWVPRLGGKLDAVPGRTLVVRLQADRPGTYHGVCAEFCGLDHAHMALTVIAMDPAAFDACLSAQTPPQSVSDGGFK
jgi:cytochrome c oxidase subunit 2